MATFVSASTLIRRMFGKLEVFQPGESVPPTDAADALADMNSMLGSWALQPLTKPAQVREVFPITADLGVYTIGPGGDFDTQRPERLTGAAILLNSQGTPAAVTSLTRSGGVVTVTMTSHGGSVGQNVTIAGATEGPYNGTFPIATVPTANTFTYLFSGSPTSPATGTITASLESEENDVVEVPRAVITQEAWQAIRIKSLRSSQFTNVFYNPTFADGLGTVNLWPVPNVATNAIVLYSLQAIRPFANLTTSYQLPNGYDEAIVYNLAKRRAPDYGKTPSPIVLEMASMTLAAIKRANTKLVDLATDPALTHDPGGYYDIISGSGTNA
jgi:hypothetical protein